MKKLIVSLLIGMILSAASGQKFEELALTPPMGWNSWNDFACDVNETKIMEVADAMVESGMRDAGYSYIVIDDCWHGERDSLGFITANPDAFPSGIKALADYIHSKGLKFGIYSSAGFKTCAGRPASRGYEYQDAMKYAEWGVDYLKYDWCGTEGLKARGAYLTMRDAIYKAGRPMIFSLCEWGNDEPWKWGSRIGHLWRTTGDIYNCFDCKYNHGGWFSWDVLQILDMRDNDLLRKYAGPDHWNDPDMMEVGNGMTVNEDRAHFSLWAMLAAPLIAGNDLRNMTPETREILMNREVIAIDQDSLGIQAFEYQNEDSIQIFVKPLSDLGVAICFLNRGTAEREIEFKWKEHTFVDEVFDLEYEFKRTTYKIRDVWAHQDVGNTKKSLKAILGGHDAYMLSLQPLE
jgi:alpha-galactosidase